IVSQEEDGKKTPAEDLKYMAMIIRGDKFTYADGKIIITGTFKLVGTAGSPRTLDSLPEAGALKGKRIPGIYELKNGKLKLCFGLPGKKRPMNFSAEAGTGNELAVWQHNVAERKSEGSPKRNEPSHAPSRE